MNNDKQNAIPKSNARATGLLRKCGVPLLTALVTYSASATEYPSPDGALSATVTERGSGDCEAKILFQERTREILKLSYISPDHEHGACVDTAGWTPDSKFFVFSIESSGGHQSWHTPIMFFARKHRRVLALETYLHDPVTEAKFSIAPPDVINFVTTPLPLYTKRPERHSLALGALNLGKR